MADEELRAARVLARVGHRQRPSLVNLLCAAGLALDGVTRSPGAAAERTAPLDDEVGDHAMKGQAVVEGLLHLLTGLRILPLLRTAHETHEVLHRPRCIVVEQLCNDLAPAG